MVIRRALTAVFSTRDSPKPLTTFLPLQGIEIVKVIEQNKMKLDEKNLPGFAMTCQDEDPFSGIGSESVTVRIF